MWYRWIHVEPNDFVIVGGGIVGLAIGLRLLEQRPGVKLTVIEKERAVGSHQTGHNSGVIHAGLYYAPGSLKARNCIAGRKALVAYCERKGIPYRITGKLVVAVTTAELPRLEQLAERAEQNGLTGVLRLSGAQIADYEPAVRGQAALWVPQTGVVDYRRVAEAYAADIIERGGSIRTGCAFNGMEERNATVIVRTSGEDLAAKFLVNAAGLQSDRIARLCDVDPGARIVPFRGEYYVLQGAAADRIRGLVYPVPDPRFPFLGVHFTRRIDGSVECGPNAVLAWRREGYRKGSFSVRDTAAAVTYPGLLRLGLRHFRYGLGELHRSWSKKAFASALREYYPELADADLAPGGSGVRAQAVFPDGTLADDFLIRRGSRSLHVLNAPSPAATASLAIGSHVAGLLPV